MTPHRIHSKENVMYQLTNGGQGASVAYTGMIWSGFRPNDDACTYGYLIPVNMFAVTVLR